MRFKNKIALITGSNRGIGRSTLIKFAQDGCSKIIAHARKESEEFKALIDGISNEYNVQIEPCYFDLQNRVDMKSALLDLCKKEERIDILVNNAGILYGGFFMTTPMEVMKDVFDINLFAPLEIIQIIAKKMRKSEDGAIVNVASNAGYDMGVGNSSYGASKAALIAETKTLACELSQWGIRVNSVAPGLIATDMSETIKTSNQASYDSFLNSSILLRTGSPDEVASVISFLASKEASFITGETIRVDGGSR